MIKDKMLIRRLNRLIPGWSEQSGESIPHHEVRRTARIAALKALNFMYELTFESDMDLRNRYNHRATGDVWALMLYMESVCARLQKENEELMAQAQGVA